MKMTFKTLLDRYRVTIPIIQRDYAQGRKDKKATTIRKELLNNLKRAFEGGKSIDFDFIYGSVTQGELYPIDGQQRLTTLFLLHWYLGYRADRGEEIKPLLDRFSYKTRISSDRFCKQLTGFSAAQDKSSIAAFIKDQYWYAGSWDSDPTIEAMLRMLDNIENVFTDNHSDYLDKLLSTEIIHFQFLDMDSFKLSDNLYIKMNARGKPLTEFENFKARFERFLDEKKEYKERFACSVDSEWTNLFWRSMKRELDHGFMNYFSYIAEVGFHLLNDRGVPLTGDNDMSFKFNIFGNEEILELLFDSLDRWSEKEDIAAYFGLYFTSTAYAEGKVKLYEENINLFERCISGVSFVAKDKLLLYAVILQLISGDDDRAKLRLIRNLLINSPNEIRADNMHKLYCSIQTIMFGEFDYNDLKGIFSGGQVDDEINKKVFIENNPSLKEELYHFEDHYILKGRMSAIYLDPNTIVSHRERFSELFSKGVDRNTISRAMLCFGDYSYGDTANRWRFANSDNTWHTILTLQNVSKVRNILKALLDEMQNQDITTIIVDKIEELQEKSDFSWIYYFIKYPQMNTTEKDRTNSYYVWYSDSDIRMLNKTKLNSYWRDPYLWTIFTQLSEQEQKEVRGIWNIGRDKKPLTVNGINISVSEIKLNDNDLISAGVDLIRSILRKKL